MLIAGWISLNIFTNMDKTAPLSANFISFVFLNKLKQNGLDWLIYM